MTFDPVATWKAISIVLTGAFGILGLLTEFKNKRTKKITRWGWFSLFGIFVSTVGGVLAQIGEWSADQRRQAENLNRLLVIARKSDGALTQIERLLTPLSDTKIQMAFYVNCEFQPFREFCGTLRGAAETAKKTFQSTGTFGIAELKVSANTDESFGPPNPEFNNRTIITLHDDSPLWNKWPKTDTDVVRVSAWFVKGEEQYSQLSNLFERGTPDAIGVVSQVSFSIELARTDNGFVKLRDLSGTTNLHLTGYVGLQHGYPVYVETDQIPLRDFTRDKQGSFVSYKDLDGATLVIGDTYNGTLERLWPAHLWLHTGVGQIAYISHFERTKIGKYEVYKGSFAFPGSR